MIQMQRIKKTVSRMELQKQKRNPTFSYIVACALNSSFKIVEYISSINSLGSGWYEKSNKLQS